MRKSSFSDDALQRPEKWTTSYSHILLTTSYNIQLLCDIFLIMYTSKASYSQCADVWTIQLTIKSSGSKSLLDPQGALLCFTSEVVLPKTFKQTLMCKIFGFSP